MAEPTIRAAEAEDAAARREVTFRAWQDAYRHIFTPGEIEGLFSQRIPQIAAWTAHRTARLGGLVAEIEGQVVGHISLALLDDGDGEVTALYVDPPYQGMEVGTRLWETGCDVLRFQRCAGVQVWVLERARAVSFYERRGCMRISEDFYRAGDHAEKALGYRLAF